MYCSFLHEKKSKIRREKNIKSKKVTTRNLIISPVQPSLLSFSSSENLPAMEQKTQQISDPYSKGAQNAL